MSSESPPTPEKELPFDALGRQCGEHWQSIADARLHTRQKIVELQGLLGKYDDPSYSIVVFGSLGRMEFTGGSDVDWALLIDGPSDPSFLDVRWKIEQSLNDNGYKEPGRTGTFGGVIDSHQMVQHIAGIHDTNENLTHRILLLLESQALTGAEVRERVVRNLVQRYVDDDMVAPRVREPKHVVPHFFLNDVVRYWRTMATDFAAKMLERRGDEWAIKNIKLRFSRKILFVAGLLAAFAFELQADAEKRKKDLGTDQERINGALRSCVFDRLRWTPLDSLCNALLQSSDFSAAKKLIGAYDGFLRLLADPEERGALAELNVRSAANSAEWNSARELSHQFRDGLDDLFYESETGLRDLVRRFGLF